jgi:hypothetical protein
MILSENDARPSLSNTIGGPSSDDIRLIELHWRLRCLSGFIPVNSLSWLQPLSCRAGTLVANMRLAGSRQAQNSRNLIGCLQAVTLFGFHGRDLNHSRLSPMQGMLTIDSRDLYAMNWSRKGALLMLAVVVFWAAMPASACLLGVGNSSQPDCCRAMAQGCDSPGMGASSPCCQIQGKNPAVTPVPPYTTEHAQKLALVPRQAGMELPVGHGPAYGNVHAAPPQFPPGGAFALRI